MTIVGMRCSTESLRQETLDTKSVHRLTKTLRSICHVIQQTSYRKAPFSQIPFVGVCPSLTAFIACSPGPDPCEPRATMPRTRGEIRKGSNFLRTEPTPSRAPVGTSAAPQAVSLQNVTTSAYPCIRTASTSANQGEVTAPGV